MTDLILQKSASVACHDQPSSMSIDLKNKKSPSSWAARTERKVSLASGAGVAKALRSLGAEVTEVDVDRPGFRRARRHRGRLQRHPRHLRRRRPDPAHPRSARRSLHRRRRRRQRAGDRQDRDQEALSWSAACRRRAFEILRDGAEPTLPLPFVVKAPREGSSVGVYIVREAGEGRRDAARGARSSAASCSSSSTSPGAS